MFCIYVFGWYGFLTRYSCTWGAVGVMAIVVGNGHGDTGSEPGRGWLHFTLVRQLVNEKENSEFKTMKFHLKLTLCHILPEQRGWEIWLFMYLKKEQQTFAGWRSDLPCWLSREHMPIMTPGPVGWVPRCVIFCFNIFIMGGILWLYQTQRFYIICAPDTDVTENSYSDCSGTAGDKNFFNLVKVRYPTIFTLFLELTTWTSFSFSCITFMVHISCLF